MVFLQLAGLAFFTTLAVTGFMVHAGLGDVADHRSAHRHVIPTGGGIGFVAGLGAALIAISFMDVSGNFHRGFAPVLSLIFAVAMLGLIDDVLVLSARVKFGILLILCGSAVYLIGPAAELPMGSGAVVLPFFIAFIGSVLWVFVVANAVNFMDGANGLMATVMAIANLALFGVSLMVGAQSAAILSILTVGILLGFLPYNQRRKALIFSGDVGALLVGFSFAVTVLLLVSETSNPAILYAGPILILPFLTDVFLTLIRRVRRKQNLLTAHNMHLYQRLMKAGWSHFKVTWLYAFIGLILANVVLVATHRDLIESANLLPFLTGMLVASYYIISGYLPD